MPEPETADRRRLDALFDALQARLASDLQASRSAIPHSAAKGTATEIQWLNMLEAHLPDRYRVASGFVVDSNSLESEQIDVIVYDRQYTPILYNREGQKFLPAEGVYAVFEVKQTLNRQNLRYAGKKAASVRRLGRTSAQITHAGGKFKPRCPFPILAGILTYDCEWSAPFASPFRATLRGQTHDERIDLGCVVRCGAFEARSWRGDEPQLETGRPETALVRFFLRLLARLQALGTVTAIDYDAYLRALEPAEAENPP